MNFEGPQALIKSALPQNPACGTCTVLQTRQILSLSYSYSTWMKSMALNHSLFSLSLSLFSFLLLDTNRVCEGTHAYLRNHIKSVLAFIFYCLKVQDKNKGEKTELRQELFIPTCTYVEVKWCVNLTFFFIVLFA